MAAFMGLTHLVGGEQQIVLDVLIGQVMSFKRLKRMKAAEWQPQQ